MSLIAGPPPLGVMEDKNMKNEMKNEQAVSPVIATILMVAITVVLAGVLYVWANSLASDQPEKGTMNSFTATDSDAQTSAAADDNLMRITWQFAEDDLNWAFVSIKLGVGDMTYDCTTDGTEECAISQDGSDDGSWETTEFLTLAESGTDICSASCSVDIYVKYRGSTVSGTSNVGVA